MDHLETSGPQTEAFEVGDEDSDKLPAPRTVEERLAIIEREWREMQVEWLSMYDQFRSLYGRIARRQQRDEQPTRVEERPVNPMALALLNGGKGS